MRAPRLDDILGQTRAVETLRSAIASDRVHHAWIFSGPAGVGKFTTALAFAGMLIDPTTAPGLTGEIAPDPESPTQRLLAAGTHPDLHVITKELAAVSDDAGLRGKKQTNIPLDLLRERMIGGVVGGSESGKHAESLVDKAARIGLRRVFIIDEAQLLDERGQNALLKTLEEPPGKNLIILVTDEEERLLPTVRSRCQRVAFGPLDEPAMRAWVARAIKQGERDAADHEGESEKEREKRQFSPDEIVFHAGKKDLEWALDFARGSPGRVVFALAAGLRGWADEIFPLLDRAERGEFAAELGGAVHRVVEDWAQAHVKRDERRSKDAANKAGARMALALIGERSRRRLHDAVRRADDRDRDHALAAVQAVEEAWRRLNANVNAGLVYDAMAGEMARG